MSTKQNWWVSIKPPVCQFKPTDTVFMENTYWKQFKACWDWKSPVVLQEHIRGRTEYNCYTRKPNFTLLFSTWALSWKFKSIQTGLWAQEWHSDAKKRDGIKKRDTSKSAYLAHEAILLGTNFNPLLKRQCCPTQSLVYSTWNVNLNRNGSVVSAVI